MLLYFVAVVYQIFTTNDSYTLAFNAAYVYVRTPQT